MTIRIILVSALLCIVSVSCRTSFSGFSKKHLNNKGYTLAFNGETLKLKSIDKLVVAGNGFGLYIFGYERGRDEVLVPVLRDNDDYLIAIGDPQENLKNVTLFLEKYTALFDKMQKEKILERHTGNMVYHGER